MNCPYCDNEMEKGYLQSARPVIWSRKNKTMFIVAGRDDIRITNWGWNCSNGKAYLCRSCGKIIVDVK